MCRGRVIEIQHINWYKIMQKDIPSILPFSAQHFTPKFEKKGTSCKLLLLLPTSLRFATFTNFGARNSFLKWTKNNFRKKAIFNPLITKTEIWKNILAPTGIDPGVSRMQTERANHWATEKTEITYSISTKLLKFNNYRFNDVTSAIIVYMYKRI